MIVIIFIIFIAIINNNTIIQLFLKSNLEIEELTS